jgi:hypothetical protein
VESKWKNYHIITFPGQSLSKTLEAAMDLSQDRLILELEPAVQAYIDRGLCIYQNLGKNVYTYIYVCVLFKQQLTTDKILVYYSIEMTNPSSYRRGGPLPNCVGVKYENKNIITGPDGALHQE